MDTQTVALTSTATRVVAMAPAVMAPEAMAVAAVVLVEAATACQI